MRNSCNNYSDGDNNSIGNGSPYPIPYYDNYYGPVGLAECGHRQDHHRHKERHVRNHVREYERVVEYDLDFDFDYDDGYNYY